jgi:hypothetical protein
MYKRKQLTNCGEAARGGKDRRQRADRTGISGIRPQIGRGLCGQGPAGARHELRAGARKSRQGGIGMARSARTRRDRRFGCRPYDRPREDPFQGHRILDFGSEADARSPDLAVFQLYRHLDAHARAIHRPAGRARGGHLAEGQAFCGRRLGKEPVLRPPPATLSRHRLLGGQAGQRSRRARRAHPAQGRLLHKAGDGRPFAGQFRSHQSGGVSRDGRQQRRQPGGRHEDVRRGYRRRSAATSGCAIPTRPSSQSAATWR